MPGITVGDCGEKIGLNGVDNGWLKFHNYRIPRDALLDKIAQVDAEGNYTSKFESEGKRFAMSIASLSGGRVIMSRLACENGFNGLIIAIRHALMRRQFGPPKSDNETLLIDYPLH